MANGDAINDRLKFQELIKNLPPDERTIETALMVYDLKAEISTLGGGGTSKKTVATTSGITTALIIGLVEALKLIVGKG